MKGVWIGSKKGWASRFGKLNCSVHQHPLGLLFIDTGFDCFFLPILILNLRHFQITHAYLTPSKFPPMDNQAMTFNEQPRLQDYQFTFSALQDHENSAGRRLVEHPWSGNTSQRPCVHEYNRRPMWAIPS